MRFRVPKQSAIRFPAAHPSAPTAPKASPATVGIAFAGLTSVKPSTSTITLNAAPSTAKGIMLSINCRRYSLILPG